MITKFPAGSSCFHLQWKKGLMSDRSEGMCYREPALFLCTCGSLENGAEKSPWSVAEFTFCL